MAVCAVVAAAVLTPAASAHIRRSDGGWTYRYYTHSADNPRCGEDVGRIDPLNIIYYQYGEAYRIDDHSKSETDWYEQANYYDQVMCVNPSGTGWSAQGLVEEEQGHGCLSCRNRAHLRIFPAGHLHSDIVDKWSTSDVHHEQVDYCCPPSHFIDEDWELWENHYAYEMSGAHNIYADVYDRVAAGYYRGYYDDGDVTRVGGLHNGGY